jgi:hypothetical protein
LVSVTFTITACSTFSYDKDAAIESAMEYVDMLNARDYEGIYDSLPVNVAKMRSGELHNYQTNYDQMLETAGSFVDYTSTKTSTVSHVAPDYFYGQSLSQKKLTDGPKTQYIKVMIKAEYENSIFVYVIELTKDLELADLNFYPLSK